MDRQQALSSFRDLARALINIDRDVYQQFDKDPLTPIFGEGPKQARLAIFGRDPGRDEVRHGLPFIGAGGQLVRKELYRAFYNQPMPDFEASKAIGEHVFWLNTLPYKPIGNKAWPMAAKKRCQPLIADILLHEWDGHEVITLGREAFFGLAFTNPVNCGMH